MPNLKTQLTEERDQYRKAEIYRAQTARTFEESGMVAEASNQWGYAADNAGLIVQLAANYPTVPLDPLMPIITGGGGYGRAPYSRALGRAAYYRARALALLQGPPPVTTPGPVTITHPVPFVPAPVLGSPEASATPQTPDAAAQADADEAGSKWMLIAIGAGVLLAWKVFFGG